MRNTRSALFTLVLLSGAYVYFSSRREPPAWLKDTVKRSLPFPLNRRSIRQRLSRLSRKVPAVSNAIDSLDRAA